MLNTFVEKIKSVFVSKEADEIPISYTDKIKETFLETLTDEIKKSRESLENLDPLFDEARDNLTKCLEDTDKQIDEGNESDILLDNKLFLTFQLNGLEDKYLLQKSQYVQDLNNKIKAYNDFKENGLSEKIEEDSHTIQIDSSLTKSQPKIFEDYLKVVSEKVNTEVTDPHYTHISDLEPDLVYKEYMNQSKGRKRDTMPQIASEDVDEFIIHFAQNSPNTKVKKETISLSKLKPTQSELNDDKVKGMNFELPAKFIVSKDYHLADGHHKWASLLQDGDRDVTIYRIFLPIEELLRRANLMKISKKEDINGVKKSEEIIDSWDIIEKSFNDGKISEDEYLESFSKYNDIIKSWSTELRDSNPGSRWVTMSGSHVLIKQGRVIAGNSRIMEYFNDKATATDDSKEIPVGASYGGTDHLGLSVSRYSDKALLITGNTYANLDTLRDIKKSAGAGTFNKKLNGWVFPYSVKDIVLGKLVSDMEGKADEEQVQNTKDLKNSLDEGTKVKVDGKEGEITGKDVDENGLNYHIKTDDGEDINDVKEKDIEAKPTTDQKEAEEAINNAAPETRNKVAKKIFGKPKEDEKEKFFKQKRPTKPVEFTTPSGEKVEALDFTVFNDKDLDIPDVNTILDNPKPPYIPDINEEAFAGYRLSEFVLNYVKIGDNKYLLDTNLGESYPNKGNMHQDAVVSLDNIVTTTEYYRTKKKAELIKEAKDKNKRSEEYYDSLKDDYRAKYVMPLALHHLPKKAQKQLKEDGKDWATMNLHEREKYYKPFKTYRPRKMSFMEENTLSKSNLRDYQKYVDKDYQPPKGGYYQHDDPAAKQYNEVAQYIKYKRIDMRIAQEEWSGSYKKGIETSWGNTGTNDTLKKDLGVLVKTQSGKDITVNEIDEIKGALKDVYKVFGDRSGMSDNFNLKISHAGDKKMFASNAIGMYVPQMKAIGVSSKYGNAKFGFTLAHEFAHFMDNYLGDKKGKRYASDDYDSTAGKIAFTFRKHMNKKADSDYLNCTKECFARALEQYHAFATHGEDAVKIDKPYHEHPAQVSKKTFNEKVKPLIEQFLKENDKLLKSINFDFDDLEKSEKWTGNINGKQLSGYWKTINGAHVLVNEGGDVIAGADGKLSKEDVEKENKQSEQVDNIAVQKFDDMLMDIERTAIESHFSNHDKPLDAFMACCLGDAKGIFEKDTQINHLEISGSDDSLRLYFTTSNGGEYIRELNFKEKTIINDTFVLPKNSPKGTGTKVFASQVKALGKLGFERIDILAAGHKGHDKYNGYYTWPRLGYDLYDSLEQDKFERYLKNHGTSDKIKKVKSIHELMSFKEGREFWREKGYPHQASFDLTEGSDSNIILDKYLQERFK